MAGPAIRLRLIGPPELRRDGTPLRLPTRKTLALLALLAFADSLPRRDIARQLWSALDEGAARRNLRRELHRLREGGLSDLVDDDGERLALGAGVDCDARRFLAACDTGEHAVAAAFGPGPLLAGLELADAAGFDDWLSLQRSRLLARWCDAADAQARALAAAGRARDALALLARVLDADPLREASVRQAMEAHAQLDEPAAALALFDRLRPQLMAELGLQPLPATTAVAARLRAGTPAAPAAGPAARASDPLPARVPFVGREDAIRTLEAAWATARVIVIGGEPGRGKTRLAGDFAAAHGAFALVACRPADAGVPYASASRALRVLLASGDAALLPPWVSGELARLLPELGAAPPPLQSAEERARFVAAVATAWEQLLEGNFNAIVVDDWQFADAASADLFVHLAQRAHEARLDGAAERARLLIASRPLAAAAPAAQTLARLDAAGLVCRVELEALAPAELQRLVEHLSGSAGATLFAQRLHRATGGNPLFVIETLRHWFEVGVLRVDGAGRWATPFDAATHDYRELPVPASVREAVLARARGLGDAPLRLLEAASLAGDPFTLARLDGTTALSEFERVAALEAALGAQLLAADGPHGYRFAHDLVAQALADGLSGERARLLHRRLALTAEQQGLAPARVADHLQAAGDTALALPWRQRAAAEALRAHAHAEALEQLTLALPAAPDAAARIALQLRRAELARLRLDAQTAEAALDDALAACAAAPALRHAVQIARAQQRLAADDVDAALALLAAVVDDAAASTDDRAQALLARAAAHQKRGSAQAERDLEAALALLPATASALRARAWTGLGNSAMRRGEPARAGEAFAAAASDCEAVGDVTGHANALWREGATRMLRGDLAGATTLLERGLAEAARAGHIGHQRGAILNLVKIFTQTGELERAATLIERGIALSPAFSAPAEETAFRQAAYYVAYLRGALGEALVLAERAIAHADGTAEVYWKIGARVLVLDLALHLGDRARSTRWLAEAQALEREHDLGYHRALLAAKQAWRALDDGDAASALALVDALDGSEVSPEDRLVVDHVRSRALLALGRAQDAAAAVADDAPPAALDAWTLRSARQVAARRALGTLDAAWLATLDARNAAQALPPLEAQVLAAELRAAHLALGQRHAAERVRRRRVARQARLAATLDEAARRRWLDAAT